MYYIVHSAIVNVNDRGIIIVMNCFNHRLSLIYLDKGYTVKHSPSTTEVPSGFALVNFFRQRTKFDSISLVPYLYGYIMRVDDKTVYRKTIATLDLLRDIASLGINLSLKTVPPIFGQFCEKLIFCIFP